MQVVEKKVLFICTGNYYRSRFAEAVFNHLARAQSLPWRAFSRGLATYLVDGDISPHTENALKIRRIAREMTALSRTALTRKDLEAATHVIALKETEHRPLMRLQFPDWESKITYWTVHDLDVALPDHALPEIEQRVADLLKSLK
jgi:protein-tyrosine phosphatase